MRLLKYTLAGILLLLSSFASADQYCDQRKDQIDEMHQHKWQILSSEAQLTSKEADAVLPVFMEYEKSIWNLHQKNREFFQSAMKNAKNVKPNYSELNDRYVDFEFKEAKLFKDYHLKLRRLLQPETLFKYYKAEREFKRKLLRDFQDRKPGDRPRPQ